jgi:hypothetical protein
MMCEERTGFLFAHACERPSVWGCSACGKPICAEHTRLTDTGNTCIACARTQQQQIADQNNQQVAGTGPTNDPYFYDWGHRRSYDVDDYKSFDHTSNQSSASEPEGDLGAS